MNKLIALLCVLYIVCPIDLIPDVIPVAGWADDLGALVVAIRALLQKPKPIGS